MAHDKENIMVILSSPSGVGKTTLTKKIQQKYQTFKISVSHTTRSPRSNEVDGVDYHFVSKKRFKELIDKKEFYEHAKIFENYYGTLKKSVDETILKNDIIFDIDWQGTKQIKSQNIKYKIITFFVLPPSKEILFKRLSNRDMKDKLIASERMKEFYKDVKHWVDYDFVVINEDLNKCYNEISLLINSSISENKKDIKYNKKLIQEHVDKLIK